MPKVHNLHRLYQLRRAEENQRKAQLQAALGELYRLECARKTARALGLRGRISMTESFRSGDQADRLSAVEEIVGAQRLVDALKTKIRIAESAVEKLRESLLAKRVERKQAATLLDSIKAHENLELRRKTQAILDDWYRSQHVAPKPGIVKAGCTRSIDLTDPDSSENT